MWRLPFNKEFYVLAAVKAAADSRGALTPSNVHRTFSVRLNRFTTQRGSTHRFPRYCTATWMSSVDAKEKPP